MSANQQRAAQVSLPQTRPLKMGAREDHLLKTHGSEVSESQIGSRQVDPNLVFVHGVSPPKNVQHCLYVGSRRRRPTQRARSAGRRAPPPQEARTSLG